MIERTDVALTVGELLGRAGGTRWRRRASAPSGETMTTKAMRIASATSAIAASPIAKR